MKIKGIAHFSILQTIGGIRASQLLIFTMAMVVKVDEMLTDDTMET